MTNPRVSICVPTYNGGEFLRACLDSIQAQTLKDFEVILVDDASSDDSVAIATEFAQRDARFHLHRNATRLGLVGNWNHSLELSRGTWIKFLFQDDLMAENCLERLVASCEQWQRPFGFCARELLFDDSVDASTRAYLGQHQAMLQKIYGEQREVTAEAFADLCASHPGENLIGEPTVTIFHHSLAKQLGGFNPILVQLCDMEYWARIGASSGVVHVPEKLATFRVHQRSTTAKNYSQRVYRVATLEPLVFRYVMLRQPQCRNIRQALYRRLGRRTAWWRCLHAAHDAWRLAHPRLFAAASGDATLKKEWQEVARAYPGLKLMAWSGVVLLKIRAALHAAGLKRGIKKPAPDGI